MVQTTGPPLTPSPASAQLAPVFDRGVKGDVAFFTDLAGVKEIFLEIAALEECVTHSIRTLMERFVVGLVHGAAKAPETDGILKETHPKEVSTTNNAGNTTADEVSPPFESLDCSDRESKSDNEQKANLPPRQETSATG